MLFNNLILYMLLSLLEHPNVRVYQYPLTINYIGAIMAILKLTYGNQLIAVLIDGNMYTTHEHLVARFGYHTKGITDGLLENLSSGVTESYDINNPNSLESFENR